MTVAFLGSSLGNLGWREYPDFCATVADALAPGDHFLVGLDLVKDPEILEAAYNDAAGVTAAFTRNLFARMNRELQTDIPADAVEHVAFYDPDRERIEIFAEARREVLTPGARAWSRVSDRARRAHPHRGQPQVSAGSRRGDRGDDSGFGWTGALTRTASLACFSSARWGPAAWPRPGAGVSPGGPHQRVVRTPGAVTLGPTPLLAGVHAKLALLAEMRARTQQIVAPLSDADLSRQHSPLMSPIVWDLGHIAHFEELWLLPSADRPPDPEQALARAYDPLVTPRAGRAQLALPSTAAVRQRMRDVRQRVEDRSRHRRGAVSCARGGYKLPSPGCPGSQAAPVRGQRACAARSRVAAAAGARVRPATGGSARGAAPGDDSASHRSARRSGISPGVFGGCSVAARLAAAGGERAHPRGRIRHGDRRSRMGVRQRAPRSPAVSCRRFAWIARP